jgi:hypothetical protein
MGIELRRHLEEEEEPTNETLEEPPQRATLMKRKSSSFEQLSCKTNTGLNVLWAGS